MFEVVGLDGESCRETRAVEMNAREDVGVKLDGLNGFEE